MPDYGEKVPGGAAHEPQRVTIVNEFVVDAGFKERQSKALFRFSVLRPRSLATIVLQILFGIILGMIALIPASIPLWQGAIFGLCIGLGATGIQIAGIHSRAKSRNPALSAIGATYGSGFGPTTFIVRTPLATTEVSYSAYESLIVFDCFVFMKGRNSRIYAMLPVELFPGESAQLVADRIAAAGSLSVN